MTEVLALAGMIGSSVAIAPPVGPEHNTPSVRPELAVLSGYSIPYSFADLYDRVADGRDPLLALDQFKLVPALQRAESATVTDHPAPAGQLVADQAQSILQPMPQSILDQPRMLTDAQPLVTTARPVIAVGIAGLAQDATAPDASEYGFLVLSRSGPGRWPVLICALVAIAYIGRRRLDAIRHPD